MAPRRFLATTEHFSKLDIGCWIGWRNAKVLSFFVSHICIIHLAFHLEE